MVELENNGVEIYKFPTDDETVSEINTVMNVSFYFAYCSSDNNQMCSKTSYQ